MKISIINGPNLNLVGTREPEVYGNISLDEFLLELKNQYADHDIRLFQHNVEGEIINEIHQSKERDALIINAGAYAHTSIAIADALKAIQPIQIIEVHLSNIFSREEYRHHSFISPIANGLICGYGVHSYTLAMQSLLLGENKR